MLPLSFGKGITTSTSAKVAVWGREKKRGKKKKTHTHSLLGVVQMDSRCFREEVAKERDIEPQAAGKTLCQKRMKTLRCSTLKSSTPFSTVRFRN